MQSFLITGNNQETQAEALKLAEEASSKFDIQIFSTTEDKGIALIREITKISFLRPFQGKSKSIIVLEAENLTSEAQNAFLKLLEEPPETSLFYLTAEHRANVLPTLASRCLEIKLQTKHEDLASTLAKGSLSELLNDLEKTPLTLTLKKARGDILKILAAGEKENLQKTHQLLSTLLKLKKAEKNNVNKKLINLVTALEIKKINP